MVERKPGGRGGSESGGEGGPGPAERQRGGRLQELKRRRIGRDGRWGCNGEKINGGSE